jgi:hypothetical protein
MSLATSIGNDVKRDRIYDCLPDVVRYLDSTVLIGTVDQIDDYLACLASMRHWPAPASMRRLDEAEMEPEPAHHALEEAYIAVARSAHIGAVMIGAERLLYTTAKTIAATQRARGPSREDGETTQQA